MFNNFKIKINMKKRKLLFTSLALFLGCLTGGSGAMGQNGMESIFNQTQTTSASWEALTGGSTTGKVLGASGVTSYYYVKESQNFTNTTPGGSGLTIKGTVYLYFPAFVKINCVGADADGATGAGAGIELAEGNTLYIIGCGSLTPDGKDFVPEYVITAKGGKAANGGNGGNGTDSWNGSKRYRGGNGGAGGYGGGGAGAGIGTRGANGGAGGVGGVATEVGNTTNMAGNYGEDGSAGSTAGNMGKLYVEQTFGIRVAATGGSAGTSGGNGGNRGRNAFLDPGNNYSLAGGAGGGAGGFGGAANNIGTGGPGGGGGGGGASGSIKWAASNFLYAGAHGGAGGKNADGSSAANGTESLMDNPENAEIKEGYAGPYSDRGWSDSDGDNRASGGSGGGYGNASAEGAVNSGEEAKLTYNITYIPEKTKVNGTNTNPVAVTYSPSSATFITLPKNEIEGYQWVLYVYGKDCSAAGTKPSKYTIAENVFHGGAYDKEVYRTILLADVYGDITFKEVKGACVLKNSGNNEEIINTFLNNEYPVTVRLQNRTLYKDGNWNTLCLPFDMTAEQINDSPLAGAKIVKMDEDLSGFYPDGAKGTKGPVLLFAFKNADVIQRGKPYLVKWTSGNALVDDSEKDIHQLDFQGVTVKATTPGSWSGDGGFGGEIIFQGTFSSSETLSANDKTKLVLGKNSTLYYPSSNINVGGCRGYFIVPPDYAGTRGIMMSFDDGETTSIQTFKVKGEDQNDGPIYNLNGQRLSAPQKGINIINGKKYVVK